MTTPKMIRLKVLVKDADTPPKMIRAAVVDTDEALPPKVFNVRAIEPDAPPKMIHLKVRVKVSPAGAA